MRKSWRSDCPPGSAGVVTGASKSLRSAGSFAIPGGTRQAAEEQAGSRFLRAPGPARRRATQGPRTHRESLRSWAIRGSACELAAGLWRESASCPRSLTRGVSRIGSRGENARKFEGFGASRGSMMGRRARHIEVSLPARSGDSSRPLSKGRSGDRLDHVTRRARWRGRPREVIFAAETGCRARIEARGDLSGAAARGRGSSGTRFASVPGRNCFTRGVMPAIEENAG